MEYRSLGRTGMKVSALGLGTGQFGTFGQTTEEECLRIAHCAFDGGINLVDTGDFYSFGQSEEIVAKAIAGRRERLVVATKLGMPMSDDPNERGGSRRWIMASVEGSLRRLKTDYIDLYQLHAPDGDSDVEETIGAMNDLIRQGKIRYYGISNSSAATVTATALKARLLGQVAPHSEQQSYSIFVRGPEQELLPACLEYGAGVLAYSPLDGGWLSGKYRKGSEAEVSARQRLQPGKYDQESEMARKRLDIVEALAGVAQEAGIDLAHMAIGFVLAHPAVATALIGGGKVRYTEHYLAGQDVRLSDDILDRIDAITSAGVTFDPAASHSIPVPEAARRRRRMTSIAKAEGGASVDFIRKLVTGETAS